MQDTYGTTYRRNRIHLKNTSEPSVQSSHFADDESIADAPSKHLPTDQSLQQSAAPSEVDTYPTVPSEDGCVEHPDQPRRSQRSTKSQIPSKFKDFVFK